ncbi:MAG TPA: glutamate 5-kinase [Dokdonella sp.]
MRRAFAEQALPPWRRAVLKVGSSLLSDAGGALTDRNARALAAFVDASRAAGRELVVVSSGAVAAGRARLAEPSPGGGLVRRQALAALGQTRMVALWQGLLAAPVAQVLLAHDDLRNRRRYLNARHTLLELLRVGAVPVVNENDTVAVEELKLGDNDNLAAIVAALVDAELLLIASDVDGLYDAPPAQEPAAQPVDAVEAVTAAVYAMAGTAGSALGTGGMRTKLDAAVKAANAGIATVLFNGADAAAVALLGAGRFRGTRFGAAGTRLAARKYWLRHAPGSGGRLRVDAGAAAALAAGKSLLPGGVVGVDGEFKRGDLVEIVVADADGARAVARGLCQYAAGEVRRLAGRHTREIEPILGFSYGDTIVRRDDLVALDEAPA